eukprot:CAMPEP_0113528092 /NCGR_PEP_ID=MMETSP0015_2-20120614/1651_1 /TAXON_ID=2838 /ORGANISM="Odontella" /LENGTH=137 /DNA_ID=CAMNT_0000426583 /DNA_START=181 /DNA_END=591 /DNA_ORIENTATION=+ /assembly_acc=CAM_ASM_000160
MSTKQRGSDGENSTSCPLDPPPGSALLVLRGRRTRVVVQTALGQLGTILEVQLVYLKRAQHGLGQFLLGRGLDDERETYGEVLRVSLHHAQYRRGYPRRGYDDVHLVRSPPPLRTGGEVILQRYDLPQQRRGRSGTH